MFDRFLSCQMVPIEQKVMIKKSCSQVVAEFHHIALVVRHINPWLLGLPFTGLHITVTWGLIKESKSIPT
jgi:hypothetical protein